MTNKQKLPGPPDEHGLSKPPEYDDFKFAVLMARIDYLKGQIKVLRDNQEGPMPCLWQSAIDTCNKLFDDVLTCQKAVARSIMQRKWNS